MAGFAVANPRPIDLGAGFTQAGDNLVRVASLLEQRRQREEDFKTQALIGASQSDIGVYAPEALDELKGLSNREDITRVVANAGQRAAVQKQKHLDLLAQAASMQQALATPGNDHTGILAAQQNALTSSGLPGDIIASVQSRTGSAATEGMQQRGQVMEGRGYQEAQQNEDRAYREREQFSAEARAESAWQRRHAIEVSDAVSREDRAAKAELRNMYQRKAIDLGLPADSPTAIVDEANSRAIHQKSAMTAQEMTANTGMVNWLDKVRTSKKMKGEGSFEDIATTLSDGITRGGSTGGSLVPVPVISNDGWFGTDYRIELKPWDHAQFEIAKLNARAFEMDDKGRPVVDDNKNPIVLDEDAARLIGIYQEAVSSGKNRWVQAATAPMSPEERDAALNDGATPYAGAQGVTDPEMGGPKKIGATPRGGAGPKTISATPTVEMQGESRAGTYAKNRPITPTSKGTATLRGAADAGAAYLERAIGAVIPGDRSADIAKKIESEFSYRFGGAGREAGDAIRDAELPKPGKNAANYPMDKLAKQGESAKKANARLAKEAREFAVQAVKALAPHDRSKELVPIIEAEFRRRVSSRNK